MAGRAVCNWFLFLLLRLFDLQTAVFAPFPVDVACMLIFICPILRKYSPHFQNAKVSVMGSAQLSQVMTTISK